MYINGHPAAGARRK